MSTVVGLGTCAEGARVRGARADGLSLGPGVVAPSSAPGASVRAEGAWRAVDAAWRRVRRALALGLPERLDPFLHAGAVANVLFGVACVTGVLLLFWYVPSVGEAHSSVAALAGERSLGGVVRTAHRYSSDACVLFVLIHAIGVTVARRFTGGRWLAWLTGIGSAFALWAVGWLGAWLAWDEPARQVALGTSRLVDVLPIVADPLTRSFLTDEGVNSLLFFLVFLLHLIVPLGLAAGLWLHVARIARAGILPGRALSAWVVGAVLVLSVVAPAPVGEAARMLAVPGEMPLDAWYLAPVALTDRLGGVALWAIGLSVVVALSALPWLVVRRRAVSARVEVSRCNACTQCFQDCPYEAIRMVPRTDAHSRWEAQAEVVADRCVSCGICSGSCDSVGIDLPDFGVQEQRRRIEAWIDEDLASGRPARIVLACAHSAAGGSRPDPATGRVAAWPGWRALEVPCAGWVHPLTVERALRRGASDVVIVASSPGECSYREGVRWLRERLEGQRPPSLRVERIDAERLTVLELGLGRGRALRRELARIAEGGEGPGAGGTVDRVASREGGSGAVRPRWVAARGAAVALALGALVAAGSALPYAPPSGEGGELVVSFKLAGEVALQCRELSADEIAALPAHMRRDEECERRRAAVRLRVSIDGRTALDRTVEPGGVWGDAPSVAMATIEMEPGPHFVEVLLSDVHSEAWTEVSRRRIRVERGRRVVARFVRGEGFAWSGGGVRDAPSKEERT